MARGGGGPPFHTAALLCGQPPKRQENGSCSQGCSLRSGMSQHWINILEMKNPLFLFWPTASWVNLREMQHICFLSVTQQIFNYLSPNEMWDLFHFPGNNCHIANPAKSWRLQQQQQQKREFWDLSWFLGNNWRSQCTHGLMLAAITSSCCQGHETLVRRVKHTCRSESICLVVGKRRGNLVTEWKINKEIGEGQSKDEFSCHCTSTYWRILVTNATKNVLPIRVVFWKKIKKISPFHQCTALKLIFAFFSQWREHKILCRSIMLVSVNILLISLSSCSTTSHVPQASVALTAVLSGTSWAGVWDFFFFLSVHLLNVCSAFSDGVKLNSLD